jgi:hypothetical protein
VLLGAPLVLVLAVLGWALAGLAAGAAVLALGAGVLGWAASRSAARFDQSWLVRRLNAREAALEDSAALVFAPATRSAFEALQASRIAARVAEIDPASLADRWPRRRIALAWGLGAAALAAIALWQMQDSAPPPLAPVATSSVSPPRGSCGGNSARYSAAPLARLSTASAQPASPRRNKASRTAAASAPAPTSSAASVSGASKAGGISAALQDNGGPACPHRSGGARRQAGG